MVQVAWQKFTFNFSQCSHKIIFLQVLEDYRNSYQNNLIIALLHHFQRDVPSAELVMVNRIFLADEKLALMKEKKMVLEGML